VCDAIRHVSSRIVAVRLAGCELNPVTLLLTQLFHADLRSEDLSDADLGRITLERYEK